MAMASAPRSSARVLRSAQPMEPDGAAVPQLLPEDTNRDVDIDWGALQALQEMRAIRLSKQLS